jgi:hypothetical protein
MGRLAIHYCTRATTTLEGVWAYTHTHTHTHKFKALRNSPSRVCGHTHTHTHTHTNSKRCVTHTMYAIEGFLAM